ncbi:MAG: hypothetical protein EB829_00905 [Nitrosopumilus sp. H8]|nr:MAG: hypothetical protein EB829_00905 [Nitrosopumilus sp. H8]
MKAYALLALLLVVPVAHAEVEIMMEKPVFGYCERLNYTIIVSEVTGDSAIIHIRDSSGTASSAIPIIIESLQTPVPSLIALEEALFKQGTYNVDVQYSGSQDTAEFEVADLGLVCLPGTARQIVFSWVQGGISDGFMIDALQRYVEEIEIPFEIQESNVYDVDIPGWTIILGKLWAIGEATDAELIDVINYLAKEDLIIPGQSLETGA